MLCMQLGFHPYALELAGAMMRELKRTPKELRRRLKDTPLDLSSSTRGRLRALLDDSVANLGCERACCVVCFWRLFVDRRNFHSGGRFFEPGRR